MFKNYKEDIKSVQKLLSNHVLLNGNKSFHNSSFIYRSTNEMIASKEYVEALKNKKKILSVIASGDQIINSILLGSVDIVGFDISKYPKYYLFLKLAGIKKLSKKEYIDFFAGSLCDSLMNIDTYDKIRNELPKKCRLFWDSIFNYFDSFDINNSTLFCNEYYSEESFKKRNLYLQDDNFHKTKARLDKVKLTLYDDNIFEFFSHHDFGKFDLINLSSIIHYLPENYGSEIDMFWKYYIFINHLPLKKKGIALSYLFMYETFWKDFDLVECFTSDDDFKIIPISSEVTDDALMIFQKKK